MSEHLLVVVLVDVAVAVEIGDRPPRHDVELVHRPAADRGGAQRGVLPGQVGGEDDLVVDRQARAQHLLARRVELLVPPVARHVDVEREIVGVDQVGVGDRSPAVAALVVAPVALRLLVDGGRAQHVEAILDHGVQRMGAPARADRDRGEALPLLLDQRHVGRVVEASGRGLPVVGAEAGHDAAVDEVAVLLVAPVVRGDVEAPHLTARVARVDLVGEAVEIDVEDLGATGHAVVHAGEPLRARRGAEPRPEQPARLELDDEQPGPLAVGGAGQEIAVGRSPRVLVGVVAAGEHQHVPGLVVLADARGHRARPALPELLEARRAADAALDHPGEPGPGALGDVERVVAAAAAAHADEQERLLARVDGEVVVLVVDPDRHRAVQTVHVALRLDVLVVLVEVAEQLPGNPAEQLPRVDVLVGRVRAAHLGVEGVQEPLVGGDEHRRLVGLGRVAVVEDGRLRVHRIADLVADVVDVAVAVRVLHVHAARPAQELPTVGERLERRAAPRRRAEHLRGDERVVLGQAVRRQGQVDRREDRRGAGVGVDRARLRRVARGEREPLGEAAEPHVRAVDRLAPEAPRVGGEEARLVVDRRVTLHVRDDDAVPRFLDLVALDVAGPAHAVRRLEQREVDVVAVGQAVELVDRRAGGDEGGVDRRDRADDLLERRDQLLGRGRLEVRAAARFRQAGQEVVRDVVALEVEAHRERGDALHVVHRRVEVGGVHPRGQLLPALRVGGADAEAARAGQALDAPRRAVAARGAVGEQHDVIALAALADRRAVGRLARDALGAAGGVARVARLARRLQRAPRPRVRVGGAVVAAAVVIGADGRPVAARLLFRGEDLGVEVVEEVALEAALAPVVDRAAGQVAARLVERADDRRAAGRAEVGDGELELVAGGAERPAADRGAVGDVEGRRAAALDREEVAPAAAAVGADQERQGVADLPAGAPDDLLHHRREILAAHRHAAPVQPRQVPERRGVRLRQPGEAPLPGRERRGVVDVVRADLHAQRVPVGRSRALQGQVGLVDDRALRDGDAAEAQGRHHVPVVAPVRVVAGDA